LSADCLNPTKLRSSFGLKAAIFHDVSGAE
jgi:hypothetical protein